MSKIPTSSLIQELNQSWKPDTVLTASIDNGVTIYAYLGYLLLFILLVYFIKKWQNYRTKKRIIQEENQQVSRKINDKSDKKEVLNKQIKDLKTEKNYLEKELKSTKVQLVVVAKENEDKERVLQRVGEKLRQLQNSDSISNIKWKEIFRILDSRKQRDSSTFQIQMDELNRDFTQKLKNIYPSLTLYDLRLCTYIRTGLSTKEISEIMNVLPSSINVSRSRLRKKLNLEAKNDLFSFLGEV